MQTIVNRSGLVLQSAAITCDWGQTRRVAGEGWGARYDMNPIIGPRPATSTVDAYFASALLVSALAWHLLPRRWKPAVSLAVLAVQADSIYWNISRVHSTDLGTCGIR